VQFKVQSSLKGASASQDLNIIDGVDKFDGKDEHNVEIVFHKSVNLDDEVLAEVDQTAAVTRDLMSVNGHKIRVVVRHEVLDRLADIDGVKAIQDMHKMVLYNNKARQILAVDSILEDPSTTFQGDGQVIAIADTGLGQGATTDILTAF
jgi:ribosomal protein S25